MPPKNPKFNIKLKYRRVFEVSIITSLLLVIFAFRFFPEIKAEKTEILEKQEVITVEDVISTSTDKEPPPPPKPPIPIEAPSDDDLEDIIIEETDLKINEELEPPVVNTDNDEEVTIPFYLVEKAPEIVGGLEELQGKVFYPEIAVKAGIQGKVFLEVIINKNGEVEDIKLLKGIGAGCDEAAIAAVRKTKFRPGEQRGKPVKVALSIPITFVLKNN